MTHQLPTGETPAANLSRPLRWGMLAALLGWQTMQVEDGQFTREYSRIFTTLVLGVALVLLLLVGAAVVNLLRGRG